LERYPEPDVETVSGQSDDIWQTIGNDDRASPDPGAAGNQYHLAEDAELPADPQLSFMPILITTSLVSKKPDHSLELAEQLIEGCRRAMRRQ
jgi:hypothetical protein